MRTFVLLLTALCSLLSASAQVAQLQWDIQQDRPVPHDVLVWQGETVDLMPRLVQGTVPVAVTNAAVEFRYREAALATNVFRSVPAAANTNTGVIAVRWKPDYDAGAPWYDYQVVVGSNAANPRIFGRITMRQTIGWHASTNPPPAVALYPSRAELQAASNALSAALQAEGNTRAAVDQTNAAAIAAHAARKDNPHGLTASLIGAATPSQLDAVLQFALSSISTYAQTNRVMRWNDSADSNVFWQASGGTNISAWRVETVPSWILYGNDGSPHPVTGMPAGEITDENVAGRVFIASDGYAVGAIESTGFPGRYNYTGVRQDHYYYANYQEGFGAWMYCGELDEMLHLILETATVTNAVASYMMTTGNVWQAVSETRQTADDALLAADSAWAALNNHLGISDPHPGKYAPASVTNAPEWIVYSNVTANVTLTNRSDRPLYLYATGNVSVAFSGLRAPSPVYFVARGPSSLTFPAGTHFVGGACWQTNMSNHFIVWRYGTNLFCNPVTTSED